MFTLPVQQPPEDWGAAGGYKVHQAHAQVGGVRVLIVLGLEHALGQRHEREHGAVVAQGGEAEQPEAQGELFKI